MSDTLSAQVTVASTPTLLVGKTQYGSQVLVFVRGAASIFVGDHTVTTSTGFEVKTATPLVDSPLTLPAETELYACCASATVRTDVLQVLAD